MTQVAQLQSLTHRLLAAGYAKSQDGKEKYLLYVDTQTSLLQCQRWSGDSLAKEELVLGSAVRPNSTAACLITPTGKRIICITPSSVLRCCTYNDEEQQWVEDVNDIFSAYVVHRDGKITASVDANGRFHVIFQDESQRLTYINNLFSSIVLDVKPLVGSPLSISAVGNTLHVYYISAEDDFIHELVYGADNTWKKRIVTRQRFDKKIQSFVVGESGSGDEELYLLTGDNVLLKIDVQERPTRLGTVQKGKFISERSVDCCANDAWNGTLTEDRIKSYLDDDPSCIDTPGGDHSVTPLAAACMTGRLDVVQLLLHHRANPNALSPQKRTPLFYATSTRRENHRLDIVRALLKAGANVDECYAESGFNTPLMNTITLISDEDVANELLNHGASQFAQDLTGKTVEMLAKATPMEQLLSRRNKSLNCGPGKDFAGQTVKLLAKGIPSKKTLSKRIGQVKELLNRGASSTAKGIANQSVPKGMPIKRISLRPVEQANELLNYGASPTVENPADQEMISEEMPMETIMSERAEQAEPNPFEEQLVEFIVALLMFIITYTNIPGVKDFMDNIARRLNDIDDASDE